MSITNLLTGRLVLPTLLLLLTGASPVRADDTLVLARVNGEPITLGELREDFERRHQGHMSLLGDEETVRKTLDSLVRRRLFTQEGRRVGLHENPAILEQVARKREQVASQWLYRDEVEDRVRVTEDQIREGLEKMKTSWRVILIRTDSAEDAREARRRILEGEPADSVARELSTADSRLRGGLEGINWGVAEPALEAALSAARVGDLTEPVPVEEGWVIARILGREENELSNPEKARKTVEGLLARRARNARRSEYLDGLRVRYEAEIHEEWLDPATLTRLVEGTGEPAPKQQTIAEFRGGRILLPEFVRGIRADRFLSLSPGQKRLQASHLLSDRLDEKLTRLEGIRRWSEAPGGVRAEVQALEDDLVFGALLDRFILSGVEVSEEEIHHYFEEHRQEFVEPEQIRLAAALLETEVDARSFLAAARAGEPFSDLAARRSKDRQTAARGGIVGWVSPAQAIPGIRDEAFDLPTGSIGGPLKSSEGWIVYQVLDRRDSRPRPEEEAREEIRSRLLDEKNSAEVAAWEERLRTAGTIKIRDAALRKAGRILSEEHERKFRQQEGGGEAG